MRSCQLTHDPSPLVTLSTRTVFQVENLEPYIQNGEADAPQGFLAAIANLSVSTSRGILIGKNFAGPYAGYLLPVIPTEDLLPKEKIKVALPPAEKKEEVTTTEP